MPELPEAETVGRALDAALRGRSIVKVELFTPAMRTPLAPLLHGGLPGLRFTGVRRRGRYLVAGLSDGRALLMHFGMSGVVRVEDASIPRRKHEHVFIHLSDGMVFRFECTRRFSLLELHETGADGMPAVLSGLGTEPLSDGFTGDSFHAACAGRRGAVKNLLMENGIVTGIGNIYASEILFAAGVDPRRTGASLTGEECGRIAGEAKRILRRAIECGGSTIADFRHVDGSEGHFSVCLRVYGKEGEPCPVCGTPIRCVRLGGRSSFFCERCQK